MPCWTDEHRSQLIGPSVRETVRPNNDDDDADENKEEENKTVGLRLKRQDLGIRQRYISPAPPRPSQDWHTLSFLPKWYW
jgi:hypothetical protein